MNTLLISYDLGQPETSGDYGKIGKYLRTFASYLKPLESFWMVQTTKSAAQVRDDLLTLLDANDKLLVMDITVHAMASVGLSNIYDWVQSELQLARA
jgi:hypothetical protein